MTTNPGDACRQNAGYSRGNGSQHDQDYIFAIDRGRIGFALPRHRARQGALEPYLCFGKRGRHGSVHHTRHGLPDLRLCDRADRRFRHNHSDRSGELRTGDHYKVDQHRRRGGGPAGIFTASGAAITINQGSAIVNVNLRGLTLDGSGTASAGIAPVDIKSGAVNLTITDCFIRHFNGDGIVVGASTTQFLVANTVSADNSGTGLNIIGLIGNIGVVDHFTTRGNKVGIFMSGNIATLVRIVDSVIVDNASQGLRIAFGGVPPNSATLAGSVVMRNGIGVQVESASTAFSYGDNEINFNTTDIQGKLTPIAKR